MNADRLKALAKATHVIFDRNKNHRCIMELGAGPDQEVQITGIDPVAGIEDIPPYDPNALTFLQRDGQRYIPLKTLMFYNSDSGGASEVFQKADSKTIYEVVMQTFRMQRLGQRIH